MESHATYDVIVVGYGAAGAAAAIEAADGGARVLVLDGGYGGGATALSGGVVYAGGGTPHQKAAGLTDTPENMFNYLRQEVKAVVSDETLRRFCETSPAMIEWLEQQGMRYGGTLCPYQTSYPPDGYYLYYSGNEKAWPYNCEAEPAARGHRQVAKGMSSGRVFFDKLRRSAMAKGVAFKPLSRVHELILDTGAVVGVRYRTMDTQTAAGAKHKRLSKVGRKLGNWVPPMGAKLNDRTEAIWRQNATEEEVRAKAVILSAGESDDASAIGLGVRAGGTVAHIERMTAWRFLSPPSALIAGITVGPSGARIANEDLYGPTHSKIMIQQHSARGHLVLDSQIWKKARTQVPSQSLAFQRTRAIFLFAIGHKKADTIEKLACKIHIPSAALLETVRAYNEGIRTGTGDPAHKSDELCSPVEQGPFYAIDISIKNAPAYPAGLTLGGLRVNEETGQVLTSADESIEGLYAAGRCAVGISSNSSITGLSLADCIFSGRRAAAHAVSRAQTHGRYETLQYRKKN